MLFADIGREFEIIKKGEAGDSALFYNFCLPKIAP